MVNQINWDAMRIKLVFLYKILNQFSVAEARGKEYLHDSFNLTKQDIESCKNLVATIGLNLVYVNRCDNTQILSMAESINAQGISQVIADEFMNLGLKVVTAVDEVPLAYMKAARMEMTIQSGIDDIIEILKGLLEKEADHA